eukprot:CAMPEP_0170548300 /NCGR_PEP_ID=MMETSP0211-20121228/6636_1 /TAXON_ID=311385 /ORGANISM="Pseudokeronopsis sp., Strain OXSARD2" /LENGTH=53 /DNA_ID=CAMNT_0010853781 /DNA_START=145 /DNA_END=306 /DNA_ORIENTATION=+
MTLDFYKELEEIGKTIGRKAIDALVKDISIKFETQLEHMKFICTELWKYVFSK